MMTSLAQNFPPGGIQQHPGVPPGHPMAGPHNPGQQMQGGMPPQMHMGVSGPGPQVNQQGAMMGGMPPGVGGPSAHALQHLGPGQQQAQFLQQQQMFANNPQLQQQQMQQQMMVQQQRQAAQARQALLAQQYSGHPMPPGMPNGMGHMNPAQFNAMRGAGPMARPVNVNLPQHLQQQQQQAQHNMEQQAAAQQAQHQQILQAQQLAMQQAANAQAAGANNHGQPPMTPQQIQNMQQAQIQAAHQAQQQQQQQQQQAQQQAQQQQQQQQQQAAANAQNQPQNANQPTNPPPPNPQAQQQAQRDAQVQAQNIQAQQAQAMMQQQRVAQQAQEMKGQCLLQLMSFADKLNGFSGAQQKDDLSYWNTFVAMFFSTRGLFRHSVWVVEENKTKQYDITYPALARYFHTHFESGVKSMQLIVGGCQERTLPNNGHFIDSARSSFVYWFDNGSQLIATGSLRAQFDATQKIDLLEFTTDNHEEYLPRNRVIEAARPVHEWTKEWKAVNLTDGKASPEMNKKKQKQMKSPPQPPPEIDLPQSKVKSSMGITHSVFRFLEFVEVLGQMNPLFGYAQQNTALTPYAALEHYVVNVVEGQGRNANSSPAPGNMNLPNSPHVSGSPAQAPGMIPQHSQQGTHSSGASANTSPNVANNKRRRPSAVKMEDDIPQPNGVVQANKANSVKASPRVGGKRQKGNPS